MRVLHIGKFFPPHPGGIERCTADLCTELTQLGVETAVLAHAEPGEHRSRSFQHEGTDVTLAACHGQVSYVPFSPAFPRLLARRLRQFRPDLLHLHLPNPSAFWCLLSPAARRIPWIVHWHADIPLDARKLGLRLGYRLYRPWEQALLRRACAVIATSQVYADSSTALAPWREKIKIIALGLPSLAVDATNSTMHLFDQFPAPGLRVLAVGRLSYFKGFDILLRALAQTARANLVLIGDGECAGSLRKLARELGIEDRVHFAGSVRMDRNGAATLVAAYASAEVFCLPSTERAESFGMVLLEAMRARLPVIASAIPGSGVGHVVVDGVSGLLVPPGDAMALAQALQRVAVDAPLRARLGTAGEQRWRDEFILDRVARQILALYEQVLKSTPHRATATPSS